MQFQISSRRENRQRDTRVIKIRVQRKIFSKQFCFIRCRRQHLRAGETMKVTNSKICVAINNSLKNIILISISRFIFNFLLSILTNLPMFTITQGTFRFVSIFDANCCSQLILKCVS